MQYIYLDWNVIQYMKHSTVTDSIDGVAFSALVKKLSKKYRFPFSEGHLRDLAVSFKSENIALVKDDLKYLYELSAGYVLGLDQNENFVMRNDVNIFKFFETIIAKVDIEPNFEITGESYSVDMEKLSKNNLFKQLLESNNGVMDINVMKNFLSKCWVFIDNPEFYKLFRNNISELKNRFARTDTVLDPQSDYFKSITPFLDFLVTDDLQILRNNFNEAMKAFSLINGRNFDCFKLGKKIEQAYSLLDYHHKFRDKINNKNRPSNIDRDIKNLFFASQAKYYITQDQSTYKKASLVCEVLPLNVKILNMSEFRALVQSSSQYNLF